MARRRNPRGRSGKVDTSGVFTRKIWWCEICYRLRFYRLAELTQVIIGLTVSEVVNDPATRSPYYPEEVDSVAKSFYQWAVVEGNWRDPFRQVTPEYRELCQKCGIASGSIRRMKRQHRDDQLEALILDGWSNSQAAKRVGCHVSTVEDFRRRWRERGIDLPRASRGGRPRKTPLTNSLPTTSAGGSHTPPVVLPSTAAEGRTLPPSRLLQSAGAVVVVNVESGAPAARCERQRALRAALSPVLADAGEPLGVPLRALDVCRRCRRPAEEGGLEDPHYRYGTRIPCLPEDGDWDGRPNWVRRASARGAGGHPAGLVAPSSPESIDDVGSPQREPCQAASVFSGLRGAQLASSGEM